MFNFNLTFVDLENWKGFFIDIEGIKTRVLKDAWRLDAPA